MKNLFSILFISIYFSACFEQRVSVNEVDFENYILYYEGKKFTGVVFDIFNDDQLKYKIRYKDGKKNGLSERYFMDGSRNYIINYRDGKFHGRLDLWNDNHDHVLSLPMFQGSVVDPTGELSWGTNKNINSNKKGNIGNSGFLSYYLAPPLANNTWLTDKYIELYPDCKWQWKRCK